MKHGVLLNQRKANCSIYESGLLVKDILKKSSEEFSIDYVETDGNLSGFKKYPYDFYIINWHPHTLSIAKHQIDKMKNKIALVVEVSPDNNLPFTPDWFDAYMIIDPTKNREGKFFPFPRTILPSTTKPLLDKDKIVLGSFGLFSYKFKDEKRFNEIIENANKSRKECIVRINLPTGTFTYTPMKEITEYSNWLKSLAKSNVEVIITHNYMERNELVEWLSENTMNCFPYYRERPGLAAVADQAISAGRAIMTTECNTFRHLHKYINYFPRESYQELLKSTVEGVKKMQEDWSVDNFKKSFRNMLVEMRVL